jgi:hypothetical protein
LHLDGVINKPSVFLDSKCIMKNGKLVVWLLFSIFGIHSLKNEVVNFISLFNFCLLT